MQQPRSPARTFWICAVILIAQMGGLTITAQGQTVEIAPPKLSELGETGRFDDLFTWLKNNALVDDAAVSDILADLERYQAHAEGWALQRTLAFNYQCGEMVALAKAGHVEDALAFAIEAHGVALDRDTFLAGPQVTSLVDHAVEQANQAEQDGDWVEVASLYRRLDLLFDDPGSNYHKKLKQASQHLRVMRLYIPDRLKDLYTQRANERGEQIEPIHLGDDGWEERLEGVRPTMLSRCLSEGAYRHVTTPGFTPLLEGALDALLILVNTQGLDETFASLKNTAAVDNFRNFLIDRKHWLDRHGHDLDLKDIRHLLRRIYRENRTTVNLPERVLVYEMTNGALSTLDEFTVVIWPYDQEQFKRSTKGKFFGVGIQITMPVGPPTVIDLAKDSPAGQAGIQNGDVIVQIDGRDVAGYSPGYLMWKFKQPQEYGLKLQLERAGSEHSIEMSHGPGIDLKIKRPSGSLTVKSPLRGTPAYQSGLRADDIIATVDGDSTTDWTLAQAVRKITGPRGSTVNLGIRRKGFQDLILIPIERAQIEIESVKGWKLKDDDTWDYFIDRDHKIGYVRLTQFIPQTSDELDYAINHMDADLGLEGLILDLRFNPGGLLNKAVDVADRFVRHGPIVSTIDGNGNETDTRSAKPQNTHRAFPVVVLINQGSASAAEIVSGALQDYGLATMVGTRSFGKGSVQDLFPIDSHRALLKLTTQYYRLPADRIIHRTPTAKHWGIEPDLVVEMTDDQVLDLLEFRQDADVLRSHEQIDLPAPDPQRILTEGMGPQLETSILLLKTKMLAKNLELAQKADPVNTP